MRENKAVTAEQLRLVGLTRRPSSRVLQQCSAAIAISLLFDAPNETQAMELMQCFGRDRLVMEQAVNIRSEKCRELKRKWQSALGRLHQIYGALAVIEPAYMRAWYEHLALTQNAKKRNAESFAKAEQQIPAVGSARNITDILEGQKSEAEISKNILTSADAVQAATNFLDMVGSEVGKGVVKAFDLASLWQSTQHVFSNAWKNTAELPRILALEEDMQRMWHAFYNGFAELEPLWPEQSTLLKAMHAVGCALPTDDVEIIWTDLLRLHRALFSHQPILEDEAYRRLRNVRGHEDRFLVWPGE